MQHIFLAPHPPLAVHEVGMGNERQIQSTLEGYDRMAEEIAAIRPDVIVFITPHGQAFRDALAILCADRLSGNFGMFGHGEVAMSKTVDKHLSERIQKGFKVDGVASVLMDEGTSKQYGAAQQLDHGVMVPMYFIDQKYREYRIVHITTSFLTPAQHYEAGVSLSSILNAFEGTVVVVASGDLSHALRQDGPYNYNPFGPVFDEMMKTAIEQQDPTPLMGLSGAQIEDAAQCGLGSFSMAFGMMEGMDYKSEVFSYEGPFGVGYLTGKMVGG